MERWAWSGLVVLAGCLLGAKASASPGAESAPSPRALTFSEARQLAFRSAPAVVLAERQRELARTEIEVAGMWANPVVTLLSATRSARLTAGASVPLPLFGQRGTAIAAAQADASVAAQDVRATEQEALWSVTLAWLDLWEGQERARLLGETATDAARVALIADQKFRAGSAPQVDVLRTAAERARVQADASYAAASIVSAAERLGALLGTEHAEPLRAAGDAVWSLPTATLPGLQSMLAMHPQVQRDRAQIAAAGSHLRAEQRLRFPTVNAELQAVLHDPTLPGSELVGGLSFEAPVLNLRGGPLARARAERALAETTLALDERRLEAQLREAYERARAAEARLRTLSTEVLPQLEEVRRMTEEGYRDGRVDLLRLLEAQRARLESRGATLEAEATWKRALADVEHAAGSSPSAQGAANVQVR